MYGMKSTILACVLVFAAAAGGNAETPRYVITSSPTDAIQVYGGLSGHVFSASIQGTFSVDFSGTEPKLQNLALKLVDVIQVNPAFTGVHQYEGEYLKFLLPVDLESGETLQSNGEILFFANAEPSTFGPWANMKMLLNGATADILFEANLNPPNAHDGGHLVFQPLTATLVPEPASFVVATSSLLALAAIRRLLAGV